jgi:hypothetical protein
VVRALTPELRRLWVVAIKPVWDLFSGEIGVDAIVAAVSYNELTN